MAKDQNRYEELGKMLESIYETGHPNRKQIYKISFYKGVVGGLGGVLGATILIALLLWILSFFTRFEFLGPFIDSIKRTVENR